MRLSKRRTAEPPNGMGNCGVIYRPNALGQFHHIETRRLLHGSMDGNRRSLLTLAAMAAVLLIVMSCVTIALLRPL
jgi:hypothetical protein